MIGLERRKNSRAADERGSDLWLIKMIAADIENAIQTRPVIFKSDLPAQLQQLLFGKLLTQPCVKIV